ncbi:VanW family protein [Chengkuizengella axinellae]|uniref:VanW family protein n=1 Tax=Chengkuizengella axinellae TaxID=3064388 RepID=A0ABT9IUC9_9BACL|nr:VanW family protein [Chengkuizengella sp. 2205SS18-9]MDP5272963.1 VanW family protein [Chengkuizengella sp. 2205SS18-9]
MKLFFSYRRFCSKKQIISIVLIIIFFIQFSSFSYANGMSYYRDSGQATGNLVPLKEERVNILKEELHIEMEPKGKRFFENEYMNVNVKVIYYLENQAEESIEVPVAFPQQGETKEWEVFLDQTNISLEGGIDLKNQINEIIFDGYKNANWMNPWTNEEYYYSIGAESYFETLEAKKFTLELSPGIHQLDVHYTVRSGIDEELSLNPIYRFDYLLLPAAYWNEFQDLSIKLNFPFSHLLRSNFAFDQVDQHTWTASFDKLPEENLRLYFTSTEGTFGGLITSRSQALASIPIVLFAFFIMIYLGHRFLRTKLAMVLNIGGSLSLGIFFYFILQRKLIPYPFNVLQIGLFFILNIFLLFMVVMSVLVYLNIINIDSIKRKVLFSFPFLYKIRISQLRLTRYVKNNLDSNLYTIQRMEETLPFTLKKHQSLLRRKLGSSDPVLQENKIVNLNICINRMDGVVINPGETYSFWKLIGRPTAKKGFVEGMLLSQGNVSTGIGGGVCQLANLLYWLILHTPLEVVERHHHSFDPFPDDHRVLPFGSGASVFYNYIDLKFYNPTQQKFQIKLWLTDKQLKGAVHSDKEWKYAYHIEEKNHRFIQKDGKNYRENEIWRRIVDKRTGNTLNKELIVHNFSEVKYELIMDDRPIEENNM